MLYTIAQTLKIIRGDRPLRWVALAVMGLLSSGLEMLGAVLVFVLIGLIVSTDANVELPLLGDLRGWFPGVDDDQFLLLVIVFLAVFFVTRALFQVLVTYSQQRIAQSLGARLSTRMVLGYLGMPYVDSVRRNTADLIRNATSAVGSMISSAVLPVTKLAADVLLVAGLVIVMLAVAPGATLLAIGVIGGSAAVLLFFIQPRLRHTGHVVHVMEGRTLQALQQALHGFRDIRLLARERYFSEEFGQSRRALARAAYQRGTMLALPRHVMETTLVSFILALFGASVLTGRGTEEVLSVLGVFAYAGLRLQPTLNSIVSSMNEIRYSHAPVDAVAEELARQADNAPLRPPPENELPWSRLRLSRVSFAYHADDAPVLHDIDLDIRFGETVGICGPTGSGKSTLVDLMAGLLHPTRGTVTVDDHDLRHLEREWQAELAVVPQQVFLTDDTLRRNVALGMPDEEIDDLQVAQALALAQLGEFTASLPEGVETMAGEDGVRLSGGQRQRIAIARALYRRASFLILDEGTSALDNSTEREFMRALDEVRRDRTVVLVAHRLTTLERCDRIVYLEHGRIVGIGTYAELLRDTPGFRSLAASTFPAG